jgi:hemerythrin
MCSNAVVTRVEWSPEDFVYSPHLDSDHRMLLEQVEKVRRALEPGSPANQAGLDLWRLSKMLSIHFNSEERLMRECRYPAYDWHRRQHLTGRRKMGRLIAMSRAAAAAQLEEPLEDFVRWMKDHIHLADRMFAAHLRNDLRCRLVS